jgi:anti-sigma factor RsiW
MMCHDAREQFSALVDDALAADGFAALDAHLATCADCRRELQRFATRCRWRAWRARSRRPVSSIAARGGAAHLRRGVWSAASSCPGR